MNTAPLDVLTDIGIASVRADIEAMLTDAEVGAVTATYRAAGTRTASFGAGTVSHAETTTTIVCVVTPIAEAEVAGSPILRRGDVRILIAVGELTSTPRVDDRIVTAAGTTYSVLEVERYSFGTHYALVGREAP